MGHATPKIMREFSQPFREQAETANSTVQWPSPWPNVKGSIAVVGQNAPQKYGLKLKSVQFSHRFLTPQTACQ